MSLCVVLAISAIVSPLLLFFGLKYGTIATLQHRLLEDPRNREIRYMSGGKLTSEWIASIGSRSDVGFIVPSTRRLASSAKGYIETKNNIRLLDLLPTADGDPLLLENGAEIPSGNSCVLSHSAAKSLEATIGDTLVLMITRQRGVKREKQQLSLHVMGVTEPRAGNRKAAYVQLKVLECIEQYKDGEAVKEYGWSGSRRIAFPEYNGVVVTTYSAIPPVQQARLVSKTGFSKVEDISDTFDSITGYSLPSGKYGYLLTSKRGVESQNIEAAKRKLRGVEFVMSPWIAPRKGTVEIKGSSVTCELGVMSALQQAQLRFSPIKVSGSETDLRALIPAAWAVPIGTELNIADLDSASKPLSFSIRVVGYSLKNKLLLASETGGVLNLSSRRELVFEPDTKVFLLQRTGYANFRLYAASLKDVGTLSREFEEQGIIVSSNEAQIQNVEQLHAGLSQIFWLIAGIGVTGGIAALIANLYGIVERKKKELSVLRLMGFSKGQVAAFPVCQAVFLICGGYIVSLGAFWGISSVINAAFRKQLQGTEQFCSISIEHLVLAFVIMVLAAIGSSLLAVLRTLTVDATNALREE